MTMEEKVKRKNFKYHDTKNSIGGGGKKAGEMGPRQVVIKERRRQLSEKN